jgi:subtilase family serine protease
MYNDDQIRRRAMNKTLLRSAVGAAVVSLLMVGTLQTVSGAKGAPNPVTDFGPQPILQGNGPWQIDNNTVTVNKACADSTDGASCAALVVGKDKIKGQSPFGNDGSSPATVFGIGNNPGAYSPSQIIGAYNFPTATTSGILPGTGKVIAIVDSYDNPNVVADLATFNSQFGVPQLASCTITSTSGPCFQKVSESGGTSFPAFDPGWAEEISLDVEWAHAIAPGASILLVEATTNGYSDLSKSVVYAAGKASYVSMSWTAREVSVEKTFDGAFANTKVSFFAASGDTGIANLWPSASPKVISVGGTSLALSSTGSVASETGWNSGGGGCSTYETASTAQASYPTYAQVSCAGKRASPDVAAVADPNTGVLVYNSNDYYGVSGWFTVGGTSVATPIWAARAAISGAVVNQTFIYGTSNGIAFNDITSGGNAAGCLVGYDMCSGLGSWNN